MTEIDPDRGPSDRETPRTAIGAGRFLGIVPKLALAAAGLVVALAVAEVVFRVAGLGPSRHRPSTEEVILPVGAEPVRAPFGYIPHSMVRSTYGSDPRKYFGPGARVDHSHNSRGWRDREHELEKPAGTLRILGLGDSYLWGQGVRIEDTLLVRLERRLNLEIDDHPVETINSAEFGSNTVHQLASFEGAGIHYQPELELLWPEGNGDPPGGYDEDLARAIIEFYPRYLAESGIDVPPYFLGGSLPEGG